MQQINAVFTFVGDDRAGLVEQLAIVVAEHDGNWLESRLAKMAGKFAGIVRIAIAPDRLDALTAALQGLRGLSVALEPDAQVTADADADLRTVQVVGNDRPGIVREVARALSACSLNIVDLQSGVTSAPMAGIPLFEATVKFAAPTAMKFDQLEAALELIANQLDIDISFIGAG